MSDVGCQKAGGRTQRLFRDCSWDSWIALSPPINGFRFISRPRFSFHEVSGWFILLTPLYSNPQIRKTQVMKPQPRKSKAKKTPAKKNQTKIGRASCREREKNE